MLDKTGIEPDVAACIAAELEKSAKYSCLNPDTLSRAAAWGLAHGRTNADAVKAAKRKLHQIYSAFLPAAARKKALKLASAVAEGEGAGRLEACMAILRLHASTAERIPHLGAIGRLIRSCLPDAGGTVLDLACGLNPFALPMLDLPADVVYLALDIDRDLALAADRFLKAFNPASICECRDVISSSQGRHADVVLMLKCMTTFERQEKGSAAWVLKSLDAGAVILSFPLASLGGKKKGMEGNYREAGQRMLADAGMRGEEVVIGNEMFFRASFERRGA